jgi:hypothetical protein
MLDLKNALYLDISFPRSRDRLKMMKDLQYFVLGNQALNFLLRPFAHDDALE